MTLTRRMAMGCSEGKGSRYDFKRLGSVGGGGTGVVDEWTPFFPVDRMGVGSRSSSPLPLDTPPVPLATAKLVLDALPPLPVRPRLSDPASCNGLFPTAEANLR